MLSGSAASPIEAPNRRANWRRGWWAGPTVVNSISSGAAIRLMLKVTVAEVQRSIIKQLASTSPPP